MVSSLHQGRNIIMAKKRKLASSAAEPELSGSSGKVANDTNKQGEQPPTQKNEGRRTPLSRSDRESHVGTDNQVLERKMGANRIGAAYKR
jgi:hypothetical protein